MTRKYFFAIMVALCTSIISAQAATVTIDFGTHDDEDFDVDEIYSEDNYEFTVLSGIDFAIYGGNNRPIGNEPSGLAIGRSSNGAVDDTISITARDNSLFQFYSFDYASYCDVSGGGACADVGPTVIKLVGLVNGYEVASFAGLSSSKQEYETASGFPNTLIDELQIIVTHPAALLELDNFVFSEVQLSEVPLPAAVWMFLAGLGGLGFARKKRAV